MLNRIFIASAMLIVALSGCAGIKNSMRLSEKNSPWNPVEELAAKRADKTKPENSKPVSMAAIWNSSILEKPGSPPIRGFGGRFFFYDVNSNAVRAEGELVVYGFDDSTGNKQADGADKKFVFRESELQSHYSESGIGPSYSFWVPWEKVGGYRKSVTLIPIFKLNDGTILESGQSINVLDGKTNEKDVAEVTKDGPFRVLGASSALVGQADFRQRTNPTSQTESHVSTTSFDTPVEQPSRIRSSTIRVTPNLARAMAAARNPETQQSSESAKPFVPNKSTEPSQSKTTETTTVAETTARSPNGLQRKVFGSPGTWN